MQKYWLIGVVVVVVLAVGALFIQQSSYSISSNNVDVGKYCGVDGSITDAMSIQSHRSYCVKSLTDFNAVEVGQPSEYAFQIVDDQGNATKDFVITHTKPMHILIVREDLNYFQHLHPTFNQDTGVFTLPELVFPEAGPYQIFADFAVTGGMIDSSGSQLGITISRKVSIGRGYKSQVIGAEERTKAFSGLDITLVTNDELESGAEQLLTFMISENGQLVTNLEEYLGAMGHSVIFREDTLDFLHVHPLDDVNVQQDGEVEFMAMFPSPGRYKIFTQFQRNGEVITTDYVVSVVGGPNGQMMDDDHGVVTH